MATDDERDKTVKQLIDAATRAELEKWFGLPSFAEVEDKAASPEPSEDPDVVAMRERRAQAIAAVDPAMLEAHRRRVDAVDRLLQFKAVIDTKVDPDIAVFDERWLQGRIADPRELEISEELRDDLKDCTPQALLRDLHRPEVDFDKQFEIVDMAAEQRVDAVAMIAEVFATRWQLAREDLRSFREGAELLAALRVDRRRPVTDLLAQLPNRRVTE